MSDGLISEAEVAKEDEGAEGDEPASHLHGPLNPSVPAPDDGRVEDDAREVAVSVSPADPGLHYSRSRVHGNEIKAERDGAEQVGGSEAHETNIAIDAQVVIRRQQLLELQMTLAEGPNTHD